MRRKAKLPELLCPAGDMPSLLAGVSAGADAIYVGGRSFGARAFAKNFDIEELKSATEYCHLHGVKLYVTVNTLVYDRELSELSDYVASLYEIGVDALIVADLGVVSEIKRRTPEMPIHASTQMSVHNTLGAQAVFRLGCERVVLARELSLADIESVVEGAPIETEIFLHGALCVCHSGQCLMSSLVGGRSGNRGECAQPCRLPYGNGYPLSLSDLSLAEHITELISSGVASLKIEGRMKAPEYVYTVTKIYRRLLDEGRNATKEEMRELEFAFSRGGFTDGYFTGKKGGKMTGVRSQSDKDKTQSLTPYKPTEEKKEISAVAEIVLGKPSRLTLSLGERSVTATGDVPSPAISSPLTEEDVKARLSRLGGTPFILPYENITLTLDLGVNLSPKALNSLRRSATEELLSAKREPLSTKPYTPCRKREREKPLSTALFLRCEVAKSLSERGALKDFDVVFLPLESFKPFANGVYLPPVIFDSEIDTVRTLLKKARELGAQYALVGNLSHVALAGEVGLVPIGDFRLNITNSLSREAYRSLGVERSVLSCELTLPMARDVSGGEIVYGRIPVMLTERCFISENFGCDRCNKAELTDRRREHFPLMREFGHRNLILNSVPTYMMDKKEELSRCGIFHTHYIFTTESEKEALDVLQKSKKGLPLGKAVRRIGKRD